MGVALIVAGVVVQVMAIGWAAKENQGGDWHAVTVLIFALAAPVLFYLAGGW